MSQVLSVSTPDGSEFQQAITPIIAAARRIHITNAEEHAEAQEVFRNIRFAEKKADELVEPARASIDAAKKAILKFKNDLKGPLTEAKEIVSKELSRYESEQRAIALEKQRIIEQQERLRQQEQRLLAEEAKRRAKSEQAAAAAAEEVKAAEAALAAPVPVTVAPAVSKVAGVGTRTTHEAVVFDLDALVKHAAGNPEAVACLMPNMPHLNFLARGAKMELSIPGVRVVEKVIRSAR